MSEDNPELDLESSMTTAERTVVDRMRDRGFVVVIWTPAELAAVEDLGDLESIVIERGNQHIEGS